MVPQMDLKIILVIISAPVVTSRLWGRSKLFIHGVVSPLVGGYIGVI